LMTPPNELPNWLPNIVPLSNYAGDWNKYIDAIYALFETDFINTQPFFNGRRVGHKKDPTLNGKADTFWHVISTGPSETERIPDMRRCERIRWPRPIIENQSADCILVWPNRRGNDDRICLWFKNLEYIVVLADRGTYLLLWTAYVVDRPHQKRKFQKEFDDYQSTKNG